MRTRCADSYEPWPCVILAIDPGATSGAALFRRGELVYHAPVTKFGEMKDAAWRACSFADGPNEPEPDSIPLVIVIERFVPHGKWSAASRAGLNENVGMWKAAIAELPRRKPTTKVVRVYPQTWRAQTVHKSVFKYPKKGPIVWDYKASAMLAVEMDYGITTDHNTAEAILIGRWAVRAGSVGEVLPKKIREGR